MAAAVCLALLVFSPCVMGTVVDLQRRIIGGHECERHYHVRLREVAAGGSFGLCGGSLISDRWVLTAAHCLRPGRNRFAEFLVHPTQEVQITAEPVIYTDKDNRTHDIMLLQLPVASNIQPIALPDCGKHPEKVEVAGHGATKGDINDTRSPGKSPTLHCADIEVVNCEELQNTLQEKFPKVYNIKKYQHWFCGYTPGKDICYGDSGGGVVHDNHIYGVISFLGDPQNVCRKPAAFMDLCNPDYEAWIRTVIN